MKRNIFYVYLAVVSLSSCVNKSAELSRPNIIYILADDLGYGDVSRFNPQGKIKTPYLDQLASEGLIFTDAHATSSVCTPTRYGILTGRYNWRTKLKSGVLTGKSKALVPKTDLPAYPSYDAVLSGVSAEMLKLLFPGAVEEITVKAAEQRNAAFWSGKATASDIAKGLALGKAVANLFITRARGDGMGASGGDKSIWKKLADDCTASGETPWKSVETPARPPMLPLFGLREFNGKKTGVKLWTMTDDQLISSRPIAPPPTGSLEMAKEVKEVKWYAENLTRERLAIVHKWADGAGTYTPAGHWNDIAAEYIRDSRYSEVRAARAFALLNMSMHDAAVACWEAKFYYFNPRPCQLDPIIKTATGVPNFPAYVSGHSTYSSAAATVLGYMYPEHAEEFRAMAEEAGMSRLYGAIHYRKDCEEGALLGVRVAAYTIDFADDDGANN